MMETGTIAALIAAIVTASGGAIVVPVLNFFAREIGALRTQLAECNEEHGDCRELMGAQRKCIEMLTHSQPPEVKREVNATLLEAEAKVEAKQEARAEAKSEAKKNGNGTH